MSVINGSKWWFMFHWYFVICIHSFTLSEGDNVCLCKPCASGTSCYFQSTNPGVYICTTTRSKYENKKQLFGHFHSNGTPKRYICFFRHIHSTLPLKWNTMALSDSWIIFFLKMSRIPFLSANWRWKFHVNVCNRWTDIYVRMHDSQIKYLPWKMILSLLNEPIWMRRDNITPEIQINCAL